MSRQAVFCHNDLDGLVCALLLRVARPQADVYFCDYGGLAELVRRVLPRYDEVWFADLSVRDESLFRDLERSDADVYWLDHHISSSPRPWMAECRIDAGGERCAADIVRDFLLEQGHAIPVHLRTLVDWAHDQDLWIRAIPESQRFNDILGSMRVQELFDQIVTDPERVYHWTPAMHEASEQTAAERAASLTLAEETTRWAELANGHRLRAACCWGSVSEVGDALAADDTLVVLFDLRTAGKPHLKYHFRTRSDAIRADQIAERLGGGGHPKASGAPLDRGILTALSEALLERLRAAGAEP